MDIKVRKQMCLFVLLQWIKIALVDFMITPPARKSPLRDAHPTTPTTTVVLPIQDDVTVKGFHRGGHMRRASAGASHQVMASRNNHARHSSMSGIHHM